MPFNDGIDRKFCFSLTDFHDFDYCLFRFFVFHHLNKKYELAEGNENMALGSLLDQTIKIFHQSKAYGQPPEYLENLVKAALKLMKERVARQSAPSFYSSIMPFLTEELVTKAAQIFKNYYSTLDGKIRQSLGEVGFCEWIIKTDDPSTLQHVQGRPEQGRRTTGSGQVWKLWGGPDALEMGEDGIPEIVDYKFRENTEQGKTSLDMDLMPKLYTLLCANKLLDMGYKKARFVVRFWQEPLRNDFYEEFDLEEVKQYEELFKQKIATILQTKQVSFCEMPFCKACQAKNRKEYLKELEVKKIIQVDTDILFAPA